VRRSIPDLFRFDQHRVQRVSSERLGLGAAGDLRADVLAFVKEEPASDGRLGARIEVGERRVGVHARAGGIAPRPRGLPRRRHPSVRIARFHRDRVAFDHFVVVRGVVESWRAFEQHADLRAERGEPLAAPVAQANVHVDDVAAWSDARANLEAIWQAKLILEHSCGTPTPVGVGHHDALLLPDGRDVLVREESQPEVRPERLRKIDHDVARPCPRQKDARFGLAPRVDGSIEETDARMAPSRIREREDPSARRAVRRRCLGDGPEPERVEAAPDLLQREPRRRCDLLAAEAVVDDHALEPRSESRVRRVASLRLLAACANEA
jgi:hypothetical protein